MITALVAGVAAFIAGAVITARHYRPKLKAATARGDVLLAERTILEGKLKQGETYWTDQVARRDTTIARYQREVEDAREAFLRDPDPDRARDRLAALGRRVSLVPDPGAAGGGARAGDSVPEEGAAGVPAIHGRTQGRSVP